MLCNHPGEVSLGTRPALAAGRVFFAVDARPSTLTKTHPSPTTSEWFRAYLSRLLTSSVSSVSVEVHHPRERSLGTRPAIAVGRVFFFAVDSHQLVNGRGINLRFQTTVLISAVSCNHGVAKPAGDYVH